MPEDKFTVIKELTDLLEDCEIDEFVLDASEKELSIRYKEDFDEYLKRFSGVQPQVARDAGRKILPYGTEHFAFFKYKGWEIKGNIIHHKPKKE